MGQKVARLCGIRHLRRGAGRPHARGQSLPPEHVHGIPACCGGPAPPRASAAAGWLPAPGRGRAHAPRPARSFVRCPLSLCQSVAARNSRCSRRLRVLFVGACVSVWGCCHSHHSSQRFHVGSVDMRRCGCGCGASGGGARPTLMATGCLAPRPAVPTCWRRNSVGIAHQGPLLDLRRHV